MVLNRLAQPTSNWGLLTDWLEASATPFLVGPPLASLHNNTFYRALDHLWTQQDALEVKVWREVVRPLTPHPEVFFHDNTSIWFEGVLADLGALSGYAPDHRTDRPRVKWGVVDTEEGFPLMGVSAVKAFRRVKAAEAEFAGTGLTRIVVSDVKPLHEGILKAVGVDLKHFQAGWTRLL